MQGTSAVVQGRSVAAPGTSAVVRGRLVAAPGASAVVRGRSVAARGAKEAGAAAVGLRATAPSVQASP